MNQNRADEEIVSQRGEILFYQTEDGSTRNESAVVRFFRTTAADGKSYKATSE